MVSHSSVRVGVVHCVWCEDLPAVSYLLHAADVDTGFGSVRAQVALELASEYVIFTIFRVSIKHSKSFKGCI